MMFGAKTKWIIFGRYTFLLICLVGILIFSRSSLEQGFINFTSFDKGGEIHKLAAKGDPDLAVTLDNQTILIPAGKFIMGSNHTRKDENPQHVVYLDSFEIDRFEVTNIQYQRFVIENGISPPRYWNGVEYPTGQEIYPVVGIRWKDADAYCSWSGKRLPTEAEWEKSCRGSNGLIYPWGNRNRNGSANVTYLPEGPSPEMWDTAWDYLGNLSNDDRGPGLLPIGTFPSGSSSYGVFDLIGNASEWTADRYNWDGYWNVPASNPLVLEPAWNHVVRGSAWLMPYGPTLDGYDYSRCSARSSSHGDTRDARIGFRCARSVFDQIEE